VQTTRQDISPTDIRNMGIGAAIAMPMAAIGIGAYTHDHRLAVVATLFGLTIMVALFSTMSRGHIYGIPVRLGNANRSSARRRVIEGSMQIALLVGAATIAISLA